jgi:hypothetical protein
MWRLITAVAIAGLAICTAIGQSTNRLVTVTASPRFEDRGEWKCFILTNSQETFRLWALGEQSAVPGVSLDTNKIYEFVFTNHPLANTFQRELIEVRLNGRVVYDVETCEIHHVKMERKVVPVYYGLIRPGPGEPTPDLEGQFFPHRHERALGGCIPGPEKTTEVQVCAACKAAYLEWKQNTKERGK